MIYIVARHKHPLPQYPSCSILYTIRVVRRISVYTQKSCQILEVKASKSDCRFHFASEEDFVQQRVSQTFLARKLHVSNIIRPQCTPTWWKQPLLFGNGRGKIDHTDCLLRFPLRSSTSDSRSQSGLFSSLICLRCSNDVGTTPSGGSVEGGFFHEGREEGDAFWTGRLNEDGEFAFLTIRWRWRTSSGGAYVLDGER